MLVTIAHPVDETELVLLRMHLEAEDIPFFIHNEYFGGLHPGPQIPLYNQRSIQVLPEDEAVARELVWNLRAEYVPTGENFSFLSKLRMILEFALFRWFIPGETGKKQAHRTENSDIKNEEISPKE